MPFPGGWDRARPPPTRFAGPSIPSLDDAFLRHGRFDYVLPFGPPDEQARLTLWTRAQRAGAPDIDLDVLVAISDGFTPADILHASLRVAQATFEQTLASGKRARAPFAQPGVAARAPAAPTAAAASSRRPPRR